MDQWFSNFLYSVPAQKIFDSPSTTIMMLKYSNIGPIYLAAHNLLRRHNFTLK